MKLKLSERTMEVSLRVKMVKLISEDKYILFSTNGT